MKNRISAIRDDLHSFAPPSALSSEILDSFYQRYNHREFVHPDPLEFLYNYDDILDREIAGLVASSLAYGRVNQILKSVKTILDRMGSPTEFIKSTSLSKLKKTFRDFKHRFTTGDEIASLLYGTGKVLNRYGSLQNCFVKGMSPGSEINSGIGFLVEEIANEAKENFKFLLPHPSQGSACKRLNLFIRWMVRHDDVDPGGWDKVMPGTLLIPLDVHMFRICSALGLTCRKQADFKSVLEITEAFRKINPIDPVKYDFTLTRLGIREELSPFMLLDECRLKRTA